MRRTKEALGITMVGLWARSHSGAFSRLLLWTGDCRSEQWLGYCTFLSCFFLTYSFHCFSVTESVLKYNCCLYWKSQLIFRIAGNSVLLRNHQFFLLYSNFSQKFCTHKVHERGIDTRGFIQQDKVFYSGFLTVMHSTRCVQEEATRLSFYPVQ